MGIRKHILYVSILFVTFLISGVSVSATCPFAGPNTPDAVVAMLGLVLLSHSCAFILSCFFSRFTVRLALYVALLAALPAVVFTGFAVKNGLYGHFYAASDTFRANLGAPIPSSVRHIAYISLEESMSTQLTFRFDIASNDLHRIIATQGFFKVSPDELKCPDDFFAYPAYLPMSGDYVLYQNVEPTGPSPVVTLKVNANHTHAIFRRESRSFYRAERWQRPDHQRAISGLKKKETGRRPRSMEVNP